MAVFTNLLAQHFTDFKLHTQKALEAAMNHTAWGKPSNNVKL